MERRDSPVTLFLAASDPDDLLAPDDLLCDLDDGGSNGTGNASTMSA